MGRGNWTPSGSASYRGACWVYVDDESIYGKEFWSEEADLDSFELQERWDEFIKNLLHKLPKSFSKKGELFYSEKQVMDDYASVIAHNNHFWVLVADNGNSTAVCVSVNPDAPRFVGDKKLDQQACKLFDSLFDDGMDLAVWKCPWTQSPYQRSKERKNDTIREKHKKALRRLS